MEMRKPLIAMVACLGLLFVFQACKDTEEPSNSVELINSRVAGTWFTYNIDSLNKDPRFKQLETYYMTFFEDGTFVFIVGNPFNFKLINGNYTLIEAKEMIKLDYSTGVQSALCYSQLNGGKIQLRSNDDSILIDPNWKKIGWISGMDFDIDSIFPRLEYCGPIKSFNDFSFKVSIYSCRDAKQLFK